MHDPDGTDTEPNFGIDPKASFRGWVPTVTGRLSFSVFGQTSNPTKAYYEHVADARRRHLVIFQHRGTGDAIIRPPKITSQFLFVLVAETEPAGSQEYLLGRAFVIDKGKWSVSRDKIQVFQQCLRTARFEITARPGVDLDSIVSQPKEALIDDLDKMAIFSVHVRVCRTGTTDIKYVPLNSAPFARPAFPQDPFHRARMLRAICSQVFFFIKDIGHHHQHHEKTTDTITDLHPICNLDASNVEWRSSTLYNMYRKVIEYKRQPERTTFNDCLGLLAYADAFRKISEEELGPTHKKLLPVYYSAEVSQSIQATQSKIERTVEEKRYFEDRRTNRFIATFGLMIAYIGLMQFAEVPRVLPNPYLISAMKLLLQYPAEFIVLFLTWVYRDLFLGWLPSRIEIKFLRVLAPFRRGWPVIVLASIAILSGLMILYLIRSLGR